MKPSEGIVEAKSAFSRPLQNPSPSSASSAAPSSPNVYELHEVPEKAKHDTSSSCTCLGSNDDRVQQKSGFLPQFSSAGDRAEMSRAPLLVRSSPAQGTGSYGGLPVVSLSSSAGTTDIEDNLATTKALAQARREGKSKVRHSDRSAEPSGLFMEQNEAEYVRSDASLPGSQSQRRNPKGFKSRRSSKEISTALHKTLEGQQKSGLEPRLASGNVVPAAAGMSRVFEDLHSPSSSSVQEESTSEDDDTSENHELLHDKPPTDYPADDSPYAQVRASVRPTDDVSLSINTPRMWTLSILFAILGSSTNLFFSLRYPSVSITPVIALLLVHPLGLLWDQILKRPYDGEEIFVDGFLLSRNYEANLREQTGRWGTGRNGLVSASPVDASDELQVQMSWRHRLRLWLAQGHWNEKEHCCVYISSNVSFGFAFATDVSS